MYIVLYLSSHGFGHMTRSLAIIEYILKNTNYNISVACNKNQNDFAKTYLKDYGSRIIYKDIITDIGLVNKKSSLEVDAKLLEKELNNFINSWDNIITNEYNILKSLNLKCIISDISPIGCLLGHKLGEENILISNFTWVEQYEFLNIDENIISKFRQAYSHVTKFIKYDLCLPISSVNCQEVYEVGFTCRKIDFDKVEKIKNQYGNSILVTYGKSANLNAINIKNFSGTIFTTSGIEITCENNCNIVNLPIDILDTQNYIAASDVVITKAGWGTIAEAVIGNTPLVLIERPSAIEDTFNIEKIKEYKLGISISENDLKTIDISEIKNKLIENINYEKLNKYKNQLSKVADYIIN